jgi:hypothetical protein
MAYQTTGNDTIGFDFSKAWSAEIGFDSKISSTANSELPTAN